ncbi:MAG: hypothetical protein EXR73_02200, partial [Myxococcales bacterium]|nr:hypothetical protein [Myxococcales bacterium]
RMRAGSSAEEAAWGAVDELATRGAGGGGVICVDARGRIGVAHNTVRMPHAWASAEGAAEAGGAAEDGVWAAVARERPVAITSTFASPSTTTLT